jgi:ribosomal protein L2
LTIYGTNGAEVLSKKVVSGQSVSIAELPAGIYVANIESTTVKFLKK